MQRALIYVALLVLLTGSAYMIWSKAPRLDDAQMASSTPAAVEMRVVDIAEETDSYSIDAKYPQFGIPAIDALIEGHVNAAIAAFKSYPADIPSVDSVPKNEQVISFSDVYVGSDFVSVALTISEYTGGAHPNTIVFGVNADRRDGHEVELEEALSLIGKDLDEVSTLTDSELSEKLGDAYFPEGATAKADNYAIFLISKDRVTFVFNSYQVAPYAAGAQEIFFARLK